MKTFSEIKMVKIRGEGRKIIAEVLFQNGQNVEAERGESYVDSSEHYGDINGGVLWIILAAEYCKSLEGSVDQGDESSVLPVDLERLHFCNRWKADQH